MIVEWWKNDDPPKNRFGWKLGFVIEVPALEYPHSMCEIERYWSSNRWKFDVLKTSLWPFCQVSDLWNQPGQENSTSVWNLCSFRLKLQLTSSVKRLNIAQIYIYYIYDHICSIVFRNATGDMNIYDFTITIQNAHIPPMPRIRPFFFKQTFFKAKDINKQETRGMSKNRRPLQHFIFWILTHVPPLKSSFSIWQTPPNGATRWTPPNVFEAERFKASACPN